MVSVGSRPRWETARVVETKRVGPVADRRGHRAQRSRGLSTFGVYLAGRVTSHRMSLGMAARRRFVGVAASAARAHGFEHGFERGFESGASPSGASRDTHPRRTTGRRTIFRILTDTDVTESRVDGDGEGGEDEVTSGTRNAATTVDGHEKTE